jgi:hypothetical protein
MFSNRLRYSASDTTTDEVAIPTLKGFTIGFQSRLWPLEIWPQTEPICGSRNAHKLRNRLLPPAVRCQLLHTRPKFADEASDAGRGGDALSPQLQPLALSSKGRTCPKPMMQASAISGKLSECSVHCRAPSRRAIDRMALRRWPPGVLPRGP